MQFQFTPATKARAKARLGLIGPSGSGKTFSALRIAQGLGGRVGFIDTEHGSASKYADLFKFDVLELESFSPDVYEEYSEPWFGTRKVLRGGAWATRGRMITGTYRNFFTPERRDVLAGFRTASNGRRNKSS